MGSRSLTAIISKEGDLKVAQFGHWTGANQGLDAIRFIKDYGIGMFNAKLQHLEFYPEGHDPSTDYEKAIFELGARIVEPIATGKLTHGMFPFKKPKLDIFEQSVERVSIGNLFNSFSFAADSVWCEWAFVIDLQKMKLEVYGCPIPGEPLKENRFTEFAKDGEKPVQLVTVFDLNKFETCPIKETYNGRKTKTTQDELDYHQAINDWEEKIGEAYEKMEEENN